MLDKAKKTIGSELPLKPIIAVTMATSRQGVVVVNELNKTDKYLIRAITRNPKNVKAIKLKNIKDNKINELKVDGLFIAIGHDPATSLFKNQLEMDKEGYLVTKPDSTITNIPGVFAAGDVKDKIFRQAVTAAGMGCMAALEAEKHLSEK